jgi:catechol 2,3-dioxygenase-like lactoylglutathione lyase family enzyme
MASPVVHFEIRSADPDATRAFYGKLFGWTYPDGGIPGYTYVDAGIEGPCLAVSARCRAASRSSRSCRRGGCRRYARRRGRSGRAHRPARDVNGQPAFAVYQPDGTGRLAATGLQLLHIADINSEPMITALVSYRDPAIVVRRGLPTFIDSAP